MNRRHLLVGVSAGSMMGCARQSPLARQSATPGASASGPGESGPGESGPGESGTGTPGTAGPGATTSGGATVKPSQSVSAAEACVANMDLDAVVGQLFMAGLWEAQISASWRQIAVDAKIGSVILMSTRTRSNAEAVTSSFAGMVSPPILVAVDQEGGQVQRLSADGFTKIPNAQVQGEMTPAALEDAWIEWSAELLGVGVKMDLAPVADVVPPEMVSTNAPVGQLKRNYGTTVEGVSAHVEAVVRGLARSRIAASLKHFPGLGRVSTNTDFGDAEDTVTTADDPLLGSFAAGIAAGAGSVMISSAVYSKIDPSQPATFSPAIIDQLLRKKMGFDGVVISDDIGAAKAMAKFTPAARAVRFLDAGGDIVLTVDHTLVPAMVSAVLAKAKSDPTFEASLRAKAARVLNLKASVGIDCLDSP